MRPETRLSEVDKNLLRIVQDSFPLSLDPWKDIGEEIGLSKEETLSRAQMLSDMGVIKRIGPIVESRSIGLNSSTLVLVRASSDKLEELVRIVNGYEGITHNYERDCDFNIWFTLRGKDRNEIENTIGQITERAELDGADMIDLPTMRMFKIGVRYKIE